jgi:UDP-GlcNAc:undecaprenyl-phosphate GlcNAc-1-phosphate transferase
VLLDVAFTLVRRALAGQRLVEAHCGHLYQVAQRAGVPAPAVALLHWAFAAWGGSCCLIFIAAPSALKPLVPLLVLPPQIIWLLVVARKARRANIVTW